MKLIKYIKFIIIRYLVIRKLNILKKKLQKTLEEGGFVGICHYFNGMYPNYSYYITNKYLKDNYYTYKYNINLFNIGDRFTPTMYWFPNRPHKAGNQVRIDYINHLITNINTLLPITLTNLNNLKNK